LEVPETRYARSGDVSIAYQVLGAGPLDLLMVPGYVSNTEFEWTEPKIAAFRRRLASFSRLILFDKRGTGLSDQVHGVPTLEERIDDVRAVMEAARSERAVIFGLSEGGSMTALFAATYPQRVSGIILYGAEAQSRTDPERLREFLDELPGQWGTQEFADKDMRVYAPSVIRNVETRRWFASWIRFCASPGAFAAYVRMNADIDVRHVLPNVRVPTLVLHRTGDRAVSVTHGRELAAAIPNAELVELDGIDHYPWYGDAESVVGEIQRFISRLSDEAAFDRVLATVLFTDLVGSTEMAAQLGDRAWRDLLEKHHAIVRAHLARFRGHEIDNAGDGFLASFDGPARAIRCACAITENVRELGLQVRAGLHTGECELLGSKMGGIAIHIGARVAARAEPSQVLVSSTVRDLVAGSGITFEERGAATLKGVPEEVRLYAVTMGGQPDLGSDSRRGFRLPA